MFQTSSLPPPPTPSCDESPCVFLLLVRHGLIVLVILNGKILRRHHIQYRNPSLYQPPCSCLSRGRFRLFLTKAQRATIPKSGRCWVVSTWQKEVMSSLSPSGAVVSVPVLASPSSPPSRGGARIQWLVALSMRVARSHSSLADVLGRTARGCSSLEEGYLDFVLPSVLEGFCRHLMTFAGRSVGFG